MGLLLLAPGGRRIRPPQREKMIPMAKRAKQKTRIAAPASKAKASAKTSTTASPAGPTAAEAASSPATTSAKKPAGRTSAGTKSPGAAKSPPEAIVTLSHDEIASCAYTIWLAKRKPAGQDAANWRQAECELVGDR